MENGRYKEERWKKRCFVERKVKVEVQALWIWISLLGCTTKVGTQCLALPLVKVFTGLEEIPTTLNTLTSVRELQVAIL